jgi:hypothetical protein
VKKLIDDENKEILIVELKSPKINIRQKEINPIQKKIRTSTYFF